jgi:hypothetical protein
VTSSDLEHAMQQGVLTRAPPFLPVNSFSPPPSITSGQAVLAIECRDRRGEPDTVAAPSSDCSWACSSAGKIGRVGKVYAQHRYSVVLVHIALPSMMHDQIVR